MRVITLVMAGAAWLQRNLPKPWATGVVDYRLIAVSAAIGVAAGLAVTAMWEPADNGGLTATGLEAGGSPVLGDLAAPLTMIEWGDYQCTFCYRFHQGTLEMIKRDYVQTGILKVVFQDFPLNGHDSELAAQASWCAADQGLYWEYHDTLYRNWGGERTGWITAQSLRSFALDVGLDMGEFDDCLDSGRYAGAVREGYQLSREAGIDATPSFIIHDGSRAIKITGNQPPETFILVLDDLLAAQ